MAMAIQQNPWTARELDQTAILISSLAYFPAHWYLALQLAAPAVLIGDVLCWGWRTYQAATNERVHSIHHRN